MPRVLASVGAFVSVGSLLCAAWWHAMKFKDLVRTLHEHRLWPGSLVSVVAASVLLAEVALGVAALSALSSRSTQGDGLEVALALSAGLLGMFGVYALVLTIHRPGATCGCSGASEPVSVWVSARAFLLSLGATYAALNSEEITRLRPLSPRLGIVALASVALGILVWSAPVALLDPAVRPRSAQAAGTGTGGEVMT